MTHTLSSGAPEMWERYDRERTPARRNLLVAEYLRLLYRPVAELYPVCRSVCEAQDIFQSGVCGLIAAVERYDSREAAASFESFAYMHVRGAMIDWLRRGSMIRAPRARSGEEKVPPPAVVSLDELAEQGDSFSAIFADVSGGPDDYVLDRMDAERLRAALHELPLNEYTVITLHYFSGLAYKQIGEMLNLRGSRISHIKYSALDHLRRIMQT